jgi:hypothetical protein
MVKGPSPKQTDPSLLAPAWGALWGIALGTWALIPDVISAHQIRPAGAAQWTLLLISLVLILAVLGTFLAFVGGFVLALVEQFTVGRFRDRVWAYGLFTGILVIIGYGLEDFIIHLVTFRSFDALNFYSNDTTRIVLFASLALAALAVVYRLITTPLRRVEPVVLTLVLAAVGATGAVAAIPRSRVNQLPSADVTPLRNTGTKTTDVPLLFIGLDGAAWRVLQPAMDRGLAPTFRALLERGTSGNVEALWPPYWSGAAWASILTGQPRETTGVYEDLAAIAPGLPPFQIALLSSFKLNPIYTVRAYLQAAGVVQVVPPPRALLNGKPVWQLLHEAGVDTAVVRFRFTYPPTDQSDIMVSDWIGNDSWEELGVKQHTTPDTVAPASLANQLLARFQPETADPNLFERLIPGPLPKKLPDSVLDPFAHVRSSADVDERAFQISTDLLKRNPNQPFLAVYIGGLDAAEHAFWQYRFPDDYRSNRPSAADVKRFSPVIDRYVQYVDERLGNLLALYHQEPNVVIVSDHGHGASALPTGWRGWHTKEGIFVAAGPSIPKTTGRVPVSYYDILPTLVSLKGFDKPSGLRGHPLFAHDGQAESRSGSQ